MPENPDLGAINDLLSTADELAEDRVNYVNIVHVNVSGNDVVIDFFLTTPNLKPNQKQPRVKHVQRLILPIGAARETGNILVEATESWAKTFGVTLPFSPVSPDSDTE